MDIQMLLRQAADRYQTVHLTVTHRADLAVYAQGLSRHHRNPGVLALLGDPAFRRSGEDRLSWSAWLDRPLKWRVEHYGQTGALTQISGGNEANHWQYFPAHRRLHVLPIEAKPPGFPPGPWQAFDAWLPPIVGELVNPASLWAISEGADEAPELHLIGRSPWGQRSALHVRAYLRDWDTRAVGWSETLWVADDYDLLVDQTVGVLLRVACRFDELEFSVREVLDLELDEPLPDSLFLPPDAVAG
jgi:hypothetical protein